MISPSVLADVEALQADGLVVDVVEADGSINVIIHSLSLPPGYSKPATEILLRLPAPFPDARPDMFWTDSDLTLADGRMPKGGDTIEPHLGKPWRRFSRHPQDWNPGAGGLQTYLEFVQVALRLAR